MRHFNSLRIFYTVLALIAAPNAWADNSCKGMEQNICLKDQACRWLEAYPRKDGREVKAHCRSLPKPKAAVVKAEDKPPKQ